MKLTNREHWEEEYKDGSINSHSDKNQKSIYRRIANLIKRLIGKKLTSMTKSYDEYLLFDVILKRYLANVEKGSSVIEVGCAPGTYVMKVARAFDLMPYGVEYTSSGTSLCKENFERQGYEPNNVQFADFLSDEFQSLNSEKYDVVISRGLIEHFENPEDIIKTHMALLKPGGQLIISIPNLRGIYWPWTYIFNKRQLPLHNLNIMRLKEFRKLFEIGELQEQWLGYTGTFNFGLFTVENPGVILKFILRTLIVVQMALNIIFRLIFKDKGMESSLFSPGLLYVGKKNP